MFEWTIVVCEVFEVVCVDIVKQNHSIRKDNEIQMKSCYNGVEIAG